MSTVLSPQQVEGFVTDGFVRVEGAFSPELAAECREFLWKEMGLDPDDPAGWTRPVVRLGGYGQEPFRRAATSGRLHGAFDQLVGEGRWRPQPWLSSFAIRFPHPDDPGDVGWHLDASFTQEGEQGLWLNLASRGRALLMLFLFSDVDEANAPTRIKVGSHLDVPRQLEPSGEPGAEFFSFCAELDRAGLLDRPERETALATGRAGDVYLCHPFLIHSAQPHHGTVPRFLAQPPLLPTGDLVLERADGAYSPVERAVRLGLGRA